jgi:hypothetical protein
METKKCCKCKIIKPLDNFGKSSYSWDDHRRDCKSCRKEQARKALLKKGGTPRIDRKIETETTKICTKCKELRNKQDFHNPSWCRFCIKKQNRKYADDKNIIPKFVPIVTDNGKQCAKCLNIKTLNEFSNAIKGKLGKSSYCKSCFSEIQLSRLTKEERREKTQTYRNNNREWWRFLHRINQFNRKNKVKQQSDGTVTKKFMIALYETEICYYCESFIDKDKRTCDHKQPLNKNGIHGISNLVMACLTCNTTKRDMTEKEFINYKIKNNESNKSTNSSGL